jgi:hypothetical protein
MARRRPSNVSWVGFTEEQVELLELVDHLGNNGWARNSQTVEVMAAVLADCEAAKLDIHRVKNAMASIGYETLALHELDGWESKPTTGRFGR